jgi:four helix bundle protein
MFMLSVQHPDAFTAEFKQFLNIARRSVFEDASTILGFESLGLLMGREADELLEPCDKLGRKITAFSRSP